MSKKSPLGSSHSSQAARDNPFTFRKTESNGGKRTKKPKDWTYNIKK